jgi:hypothetical protein
MFCERSLFIALQDARRLAFRDKGQDVMKVHIIQKPMVMLSSLLISLMLVGCFGGGIDPTEDPVQPSEDNASANMNEEEMMEDEGGFNENMAEDGMNGAENNMGGNNQAMENGGNDGEAINNAADEDFLNGNNANFAEGGNNQGNLFGNNPNNGGMNNNLGQNGNNGFGGNNFGLNAGNQGDGALINGASEDILESPDINKGATDNGMAEDASNSVLAPVAENPTGPGSGGATTGGVVRYVTPGGSKLYDKPNGATLRNLDQGDHPLVNEEGEWARTSDGYYVPSASLTAAPIARLKQPKDWR